MNRIFLFAFLILTSGISIAQNCGGDSIVVEYSFTGDNFHDFENRIRRDSFDFTTGIVYMSTRIGYDTIPGPPLLTQGFFTRPFISYNANHDTVQYTELEGTGTGFVNKFKIEFTYNSFNQILSRIEYTGSGGTWNISQTEIWTYNSNNLIINFTLSSATTNVRQIKHYYTGNSRDSTIFQNDTNATWINVEKYFYKNDINGIKDSLFIQRWDNTSNAWIDSLNAKFDTLYTVYSAFIGDSTISTGPGYFYRIDSLSNKVLLHNDYFSEYEIFYFNYIHNHLKLVRHEYHGAGHSDHDYVYNIFGIISHSGGSSSSSHADHSGGTSYDSLGHPKASTSHHNTMASGIYRSQEKYNYSSSNNISLSYIPIENMCNVRCAPDSTRAIVMVNGGCGPYQFTWNPSLGLSDDSIAEPMIDLNAPITYTITVTDSTGHTATTTLDVQVENYASISFDTTFCSGCPVVLSTQTGAGYSYQWYRNDTIIVGANSNQYTATSSGNYTVEIENGGCDMEANPVQLTLTGLTRVTGRVYLDVDSNCTFNTGDQGLQLYGTSPYLIKIQRWGNSVFVLPDSNGNYDVPLDTGTFFFSLINPASVLTPSCPDSGIISVTIPAYGDTINGADLVLRPLFSCQRLSVWLTATRFRPCLPTQIIVNYFNEGSVIENNPEINLTLPPELINITTSTPFTILPGNVYNFLLPPLSIGESGSITVSAEVICNPATLLNATLCLDAEINPVDFCSFQPDSTWDGSNIRVYSYCDNDSDVCFIIENDAALPGGDMDSVSEWRLYANNILIQSGNFILAANQDSILCFPSNGRTFRLEADQRTDFPTQSNPNRSIERCGILPSGNTFTLNKILTHPPDNSLPFYNSYCAQVFNSFDPNEKSVQPSDVWLNNYIRNTETIKYRIDFQNTGNDTAFTIMITDEITGYFNLTTLNLLYSSHPYHFRIEGNTLIWEFQNIMLPDSNIDEQNSHGHVEFSIELIPGLQNGTDIRNNAQIYFDFNPPVITSNTHNIICEPLLPSVSIRFIPACPGQPVTAIADIQHGGSNPVINWYKNGLFNSTGNDTIIFPFLNYNDSIKVNVTSNYLCPIIPTVTSTEHFFNTQSLITISGSNLVASPASSYQWYLNGVQIPGAVNQTFDPIYNGYYMAEITDSNGCVVLSVPFHYLFNNIPESELNEYSIYPNPAKEIINIIGLKGRSEIFITDITGKLLKSIIVSDGKNNEEVIYTGDLVTGIYIIKIISENKIYHFPVLIENE
jgi:hypothetical protein